MRKGNIYARTGVDASLLFAITLRLYSTVKPGVARRVKLFEFRGLGSIPNKRKKHDVNTHAVSIFVVPVLPVLINIDTYRP